MSRPLSPKFEQRLRWMEIESRFAHACPDLDQQYPDASHCEAGLARGEPAMKTKRKGKGKGC